MAGRGVRQLGLAVLVAAAMVAASTAAGAAPSTFPIPGTFDLRGISCPTPSNCLAYGDSGGASSFLLPFVDGQVSSPQPVAGVARFNSIACADSDDCYAVGQGQTGLGVVVPITFGIIGSATTVPGTNTLNGISCYPGTTTCVAVGSQVVSTTTAPFTSGAVVTLDDGVPTGTVALSSSFLSLSSIACPASASCVAVGTGVQPSLSTNAGVLPVNAGVPGTAQQIVSVATLATIACPSTSQCLAAGSGAVVPVAGGIAGTPDPISGVGSFTGSLCVSTLLCYLMGSTTATTGFIAPMTSGTVGALQSLADTSAVNGLACATPTSCVAAATLTNGEGDFTGAIIANAIATPPPTVSSVAFSGSGTATTVTVTGSGFGAYAPEPSPLVPVSCAHGDTSYDYTAGTLSFTDTTEGWAAGTPGSCIGLSINSWSDTQVTFGFGAGYVYPKLTQGDAYQVSILTTVASGTATTATSTPAPTIKSVAFTGTGAALTLTVKGTNFGTRVPLGDPLGPLTCTPGDTSHDFASGALFFTDSTGGWTAGLPDDCIGLTVHSWANTKLVLGLGAEYPSFAPVTNGDSFQVGVLGTTLSATVGAGPAPTVTSVAFTGKGKGVTITITGKRFGATAPAPNPSTPVNCVAGDTSFDYSAGVLSFEDVTQNWTAGQTGSCIGLIVKKWSNTKVMLRLGADAAAYAPVTKGDSYVVEIGGTSSSGTV